VQKLSAVDARTEKGDEPVTLDRGLLVMRVPVNAKDASSKDLLKAVCGHQNSGTEREVEIERKS
jgi:hypothetical protein